MELNDYRTLALPYKCSSQLHNVLSQSVGVSGSILTVCAKGGSTCSATATYCGTLASPHPLYQIIIATPTFMPSDIPSSFAYVESISTEGTS